MNQQAAKEKAAKAALSYIEEGMVIGVGSGSTVECFIDCLKPIKQKIEAAVASSKASAQKLKSIGIPLLDLNSASDLPLYIDGADEIDASKQMIKGGGGALTQEKIIANVAKRFICIADESKFVDLLGEFPIAIEVIPMARSYVARKIVQLGGDPVYREGFVTDNGNVILDVYNMKLLNPADQETKLKNIVGVVENGIFAHRRADLLLLGNEKDVKKI